MRRSRAVVWAVSVFTLASSAGLTACSTNPTTGRSQFNAMSRSDEVALGAQLQPQFVQEMGGELNDPVVTGYVARIGQLMAAQTEGDNPSLPWSFTVVNTMQVNAFALPGGKVFMTRGLLSEMTNEAQLAAVLGHEIGHVTARHTNDRMVNATAANVLGTVAAVAVGAATDSSVATDVAATAFRTGGNLVVLKYSRDQESEADSLGMRYMSRVNYNPVGARQVQEVLKRVSGGSQGSEFFASHPLSDTRIQRINAELKKPPYKAMVDNPQFRFGEEEFRQNVLMRLAQLPPAPKEARLSPEAEAELALAHAGCGHNHGSGMACAK
jgi:predicted Zn-dependent protease